jgi:GT2 family glycosyltransferase
MIDSDTIPPVDAIERLLSHGKPVVTGLTPILTYREEGGWETYDNAFVEVERDTEGKVTKTHIAERGTGLQEVFRCGAACLLIKRSVLKQLEQPYFRFVMNDANTQPIRSEDIDFCDRVRALGIPILADTEVICQHYKDIML